MDPRQLVEAALSALVAGDVDGHLAYVSDEVVVQLNENPSRRGKASYQQSIEALRDNGEVITGFAVVGVTATPDGAAWVQVDERHQVPAPMPTRHTSPSIPATYGVEEDAISQVKMTAFIAPNRRFRYP